MASNDSKSKFKRCFYCRKLKPLNEIHEITIKCNCYGCNTRKKESLKRYLYDVCDQCYKAATKFTPSGNEDIDNLIMSTLIYGVRLDFAPFDKFKDLKFIAEGGFKYNRHANKIVVLKELDDSKNIDSEKLNEIKIFRMLSNYNIHVKNSKANYYEYVNKYYGITQHPESKNYMIIMNYCESGDLTRYITKDFFNMKWYNKLNKLDDIISGLKEIHNAGITHQDYHSGNIFLLGSTPIMGDLGLSKSAIESTNDENKEVYGIIPYVAPEIFRGEKYTKASDIYSFGMIMWELMTGRKSFWDKSHDTSLIIEIWDGLRPPITTNAPEGYVKLMKKCWQSDPSKRPTANNIYNKIKVMLEKEWKDTTKIIESSNIGPITTVNPDAIYKSRQLSTMIISAENTINIKKIDKRKIDEFFENVKENDENDIILKKLRKNENNDYLTKELKFDIDNNINKFDNKDLYITKEIKFDI
ncbi:kinase-like domain-containing protein [Rhizophagus clarus]|uniref:Kinase-like domain-containing protein n=1 Tax=Rhizophagus clarus TaxID=94130 RepID=A0A8H3LUF2_9GLOM|nr:kinase-like domain-containing protein [Rhizophagus clarus]